MARFSLSALVVLLPASAIAVPGEEYILSPSSRFVQPSSIYQTTGNSAHAPAREPYSPTSIISLSGPNASVTFDFGLITAGIPTITFQHSTCSGGSCETYGLPSLNCTLPCEGLGVAYSESTQFVGQASDWSTYFTVPDGTVYIPMAPGNFTLPAKWGRGGFRYLTLSLGPNASDSTSVQFQFAHLYFTPQPNVKDDGQLRQYSGYFYSSDDLLNRIWHAGVYNLQLCTIAANRLVNHNYTVTGGGWSEDASVRGLDPSDVVIGEGAKRDRNPWAADMHVWVRSLMVSQNFDNLRAARNALTAMLVLQDPVSGYFPHAGSPFGDFFAEYGDREDVGFGAWSSDTYNLWTIINLVDYTLITCDLAFARAHWPQVVRAVQATYAYIDAATGLLNGTKPSGWGRQGQTGLNASLNALFHHALLRAARLSALLFPPSPRPTNASAANATDPDAQQQQQLRDAWRALAARAKDSFNARLFDPAAGLFADNTTEAGAALHPQDGNAHALTLGLIAPDRAETISAALAARWGAHGAPAPELPGAVSPFVSGQEVRAHVLADRNAGGGGEGGGGGGGVGMARAMGLVRRAWGYMLHAFSNSTLVEGYGVDGGLEYGFYGGGGAPFISHAHAWSGAPVHVLLVDLVGVRAVRGVDFDVLGQGGGEEDEEGGEWVFRPGVVGAGVAWARGGYNTTRGWFEAGWEVRGGEGEEEGLVWEAWLETPMGTKGAVYVPMFGEDVEAVGVEMDGKGVRSEDFRDGFMRFELEGGKHCIKVQR